MEATEQLAILATGIQRLLPEVVLTASLLLTILLGLIVRKNSYWPLTALSLITYSLCIFLVLYQWPSTPEALFSGMLRTGDFSSFFKILIFSGGILTIFMRLDHKENLAEYYTLLHAIILGSCLLVMSTHFIMVVLSLELISLSSYLLAGFGFDKKGAEGSLKYFLFGTIATACMIYGMSIVYGLAGTLDFSSREFTDTLVSQPSPLLLIAGMLILAGFLFKIGAAPMHLWAPDVYESAPTPVVAFFSVVPKLAGLAVLIRFSLALNLFGQSVYQWPQILAGISLLSILVGNLSALVQKNPKRMMAYSSVAQSGFLLIGLVTFSLEGIRFTLFYATIFLLSNFLTFYVLRSFEKGMSLFEAKSFAGLGRVHLMLSVCLLIGFISLTGLPPVAGFTAKLLVFSSLGAAWQESGSILLAILFIAGLLNTVISLFFYLKIPYYLFLKEPTGYSSVKTSFRSNLLNLFLVILLFYLFLRPGELMGWINRINFVL